MLNFRCSQQQISANYSPIAQLLVGKGRWNSVVPSDALQNRNRSIFKHNNNASPSRMRLTKTHLNSSFSYHQHQWLLKEKIIRIATHLNDLLKCQLIMYITIYIYIHVYTILILCIEMSLTHPTFHYNNNIII